MPWMGWKSDLSERTDGSEPEAAPACHTPLDLRTLPTVSVAFSLHLLNSAGLWFDLARALCAVRGPGSALEG